MSRLLDTYDRLVLGHPRTVLVILAVVISLLATQLPNLKLDASADSLVLEGDRALEVYRETAKRYGSSEFLIITYRPHQDLMSDYSLERIDAMGGAVAAIFTRLNTREYPADSFAGRLSRVMKAVLSLQVPAGGQKELVMYQYTEGDRTVLQVELQGNVRAFFEPQAGDS